FSTTLALSRRTTTFKAAAARQTIRIVEVPVKTIIAAILQRTRPQARRRAWPIRLGVTSLVIFAIDAAERPNPKRAVLHRKRTEEALRNTQERLSIASQVATVGELSASIAHEVNQPLTAVVSNGNACLRW